MSSYATIADLTTWGAPAAALTPYTGQQQQNALDAAASVLDSYLGSRFKLPLIAWGLDVRRSCAIVAVYDLIVARGVNPDAPLVKTLEERYTAELKWLKLVAEGIVVPVVTDSSPGGVQLGNFTSQVVVAPNGPNPLPAYPSSPSTVQATAAGVVAVGAPNLRGW